MSGTLYILSGLGADEKVFQRLDFSGVSVTFIKWLPSQAEESIGDYASRLLPQITTPHPILLGLSFGGMVAIEIAKQIDTEKVILISSAKTKNEITFTGETRKCKQSLFPGRRSNGCATSSIQAD